MKYSSEEAPTLCADCGGTSFIRINKTKRQDQEGSEEAGTAHNADLNEQSNPNSVIPSLSLENLTTDPIVIGGFVFLGILLVAIFFGAGLDGTSSGENMIELDTECDSARTSDGEAEVECLIDMEASGPGTIRTGTFVVELVDSGNVVYSEEFDLQGYSGGDQRTHRLTYSDDFEVISGIEVESEFENVEWYQ